ncbi:uncharacterized protein LOC134790413 isoform X1 [Cydia splendana]|uniref:uncharacterized protein LOC134790413 isoform X1 n=1 Tax=Cydia splendana TaxID=1100963 RepID=UPI0028F47F8A
MRVTWLCVAALCGVLSTRADAPPPSELRVTSAVLGDDGVGAALRELAAAALAARGVRARAVPPPEECLAPASRICHIAVNRLLTKGNLTAAILPTPAAEAPLDAMDGYGLAGLGDAAPPARRVCHAGGPAAPRGARSLLDLVDEDVAALYELTPMEIASVFANTSKWDGLSYPNGTEALKVCTTGRCATLLTSTTTEAKELAILAHAYSLRVRVVPLGIHLSAVKLHRPFIACDALNVPPGRPLGPPPCTNSKDIACIFEPYRVLKRVNRRAPELTLSALRVLTRLKLDEHQLAVLGKEARARGAVAAANEFLSKNPLAVGASEVRVLVMLPDKTPRELQLEPRALAAAAALAELDEQSSSHATRFKVETFDDECSGSTAYKHLSDALGTGEYGALSAVAGPACGAAFADVAKQTKSHVLPVLAYTPQAAEGPYVLRAAGDARDEAAALGALLSAQSWRRIAALTEPSTRALLDSASLRADVVVHTELPDADVVGDDVVGNNAAYVTETLDDKTKLEPDYELISQWATRAAAAGARILLVWPEDARALRGALCAAREAKLTPQAGAVFLLPPLAPSALIRADTDKHPCSTEQLQEMADGHISLRPAWQMDWMPPADWAERWRTQCRFQPVVGPCSTPTPNAALLYDVLRLWAAALSRLLTRKPSALDDLHQEEIIKSLIADVESPEHNYTGLTGQFAWGNGARTMPLRLLQWDNGTQAYSAVGDWASTLKLTPNAIRWRTLDGLPPNDGVEPCALQPLADALHADCRVALGTLLALLLAGLAAALGGAGWLLKRRLETRYRARLAALGLSTLAPKLDALDRWELPRERVVINRKLGVGAFGTVYGGHALLTERRAWTAVAVKTLKPGAGMAEKLDFLAEAEAMKRLEHPNVVKLLGVVTHSEPVCTVMEFMLYGDLKGYLLARRHLVDEGGETADEVSPTRLTAMALDAARALSYLAQLRFVHRDVAARNCLVSARRQLKLADFGMARPVCESDYYRFSRKGLLPVRWMAPESLSRGVFSPASDVWALGVLLYEIVTFGALPYQGLGNSQVLARVTRGRSLRPPPGLQPNLEGLMKSCWQQEPAARPSAAAVAAFLADSPRLLTPCLVAFDVLPLDPPRPSEHSEHEQDLQERWVSWAAPPSAATDTTYLSADADADTEPESPGVDVPVETQRFLP